jgi:hypothetical protein
VLLSCTSVISSPAPRAQIKSLDAHAVEVELSFRVAEISAASSAKTEVFDLVYRHAKAAGLRLAPAADNPGPSLQIEGTAGSPRRATPMRLLDAVPLFAPLTEDEKEALATTMTRRTYRKDEIIVAQGSGLNALMVVRSGVLGVSQSERGHEVESGRLAPGDFFGEAGLLTGVDEGGTIRALTPVVVYEIGQAGLAPLLLDRPAIAEELGFILSRHSSSAPQMGDRRPDPIPHGAVQSIVERIREIFGIVHLEV